MIKIARNPCPSELQKEKHNLTNIFISEGKNVWNKKYIKDALLEMSHNKCVYCETKLNKHSLFMEVEHFYFKDKYKVKVVEWNNLLPSCKKCNGSKSNHDVGIEPIINPTVQNPKDHLYLKNYRLRSTTVIGQLTIDVLNLNERARLVKARYEIGDKVVAMLEEYYEDINLKISTPIKKRNHLNRIKALLKEGQKTEEYSITVATVILEDEYYEKIKYFLTLNSCWDDELVMLENGLKDIELSKK